MGISDHPHYEEDEKIGPIIQWLVDHNETEAADNLRELLAAAKRDEGDASTMRGFINTHHMTPSMVVSLMLHWERRALDAESDLRSWEIAAKRADEAEAAKAYDPTTQPFDTPFFHVDRTLVERLRQRASTARLEGTGTALGDALHFEAAANEIEAREAEVRALKDGIREACDLLAELSYGNSARSPGHNARVLLESTLASISTGNDGLEECGNWSATDTVKVESDHGL